MWPPTKVPFCALAITRKKARDHPRARLSTPRRLLV
jgi:hypothetical protein